MKKIYTGFFVVLLLGAFAAGCGGGKWNGPLATAVSGNAITSFSLNGVAGTINETAKTIGVVMPFGTNVTALVATFTTTGASVNIGTTAQVSGTTANDFSASVAYVARAADNTPAVYTVTVSIASAADKAITAFSLNGVIGTINETSKTIAVIMPSGTNVTALVATFTTTGKSVKIGAATQTTGITPNNFTAPATYTVYAADASTADYAVTVTVALASANAITAFSLNGVAGTINEVAKTIGVSMPFGTNVSALVASFTTTGASVDIGTTTQVSGTTPNNFAAPVAYVARAADNTPAVYTVTVVVAQDSTKAITAFSLNGVVGTVNETTKTISVSMPFGTNVSALVASFTTTGASVKIGATTQLTGITPNNFAAPVTYTVTAANTTTQPYIVTVTVAANTAKAITAFSLNGVAGAINEVAKTIGVNMPFGTNVSALVASFTTTGTSVKIGATTQLTGITPNNFTGPVTYRVTAGDASTADYIVTVVVAQDSTKAITAYSINGVTGTINEAAKTIAVVMPFGTNVTALVASFTTTGASVKIGAANQVSGTTPNNFTAPVTYTVTAANTTTATYIVTVTDAQNSVKTITAYSLNGVAGTINEAAKTIGVVMPFGTNVTALVASFTTTGTSVKIGATTQLTGVTPNNFTAQATYTVTAADISTADYIVTVSVALNSTKAITAYSLNGVAGTINEVTKAIGVNLPFGTNVTALVASFTTTGSIVKVGATTQLTGITPNDFTAPVTYRVTAGDATTVDYIVTVIVAQSSTKAITAFSLNGVTGTITEQAKTITVAMPFGTNVTALVASFTTTGANVKVGATTQLTGVTPNDFTATATYRVTAADNTTADYAVTVTVALNSAKAITAFSLNGVTGTINEPAKTIAVVVPFGTNLTALVASFTTTGASVKVGATTQLTGVTPNNFTAQVTYRVTAADATTADYVVTVTTAVNTAKAITAFSINGVTGTINEVAKTIAVVLTTGAVTSLAPSFTTTGSIVKVGVATQTTGFTQNDFTTPATYTVYAADNSTAAYRVTVDVTVDLGAASTYGVLTNTSVTLTGGAERIHGDVGIFPAGACGACDSTSVSGVINIGNVPAQNAINAANSAFNEAMGRAVGVCTIIAAGNLLLNPPVGCGGAANGIFKPGLYNSGTSMAIPAGGTITIDAQNNPNAVFIFQSASTINSIGGNTHMILINQAQAKNIFWIAGSSATIGGTTSDFSGTVITAAAVTINTGTQLDGRAFGRGASVTVQSGAHITVPAP